MHRNPGFLGWLAIGAVVALADGYALARHKPTMSCVFTQHKGWAVFIMGGVVAHLLLNEVADVVTSS